MKIKIFLFLAIFTITLRTQATICMDLRPLLELKSTHYLELNQYYGILLKVVKAGQDELFCQKVRSQANLLNFIFEDDLVLIKTLRTFSDSDYFDYATHLEENSFSPLFSSLSHRELCNDGQEEDILRLGPSLEYHVINIDYLYISNLLFLDSVNCI